MKFRKTFIYRLWALFLTKLGDIMLATKPPRVKAEHIRELLRHSRPGDIICRKYTYYFDSIFIKGEYTHSGVIIDPKNMIHSTAEGVGKIDVIDFIKDTDGFILLRPGRVDISKMKTFLKSCVGKPYDFIFKKDDHAYYCHELTWSALSRGGMKLPETGMIVYAEDIMKVCRKIYEPDL